MEEDSRYTHWLRAYVPHDAVERHHFEIHDACWHDREIGSERPGRHLTASAFVTDPAGERVLVHWHHKARRWLQPGGHVEPGETPISACLRELAEEAGLAFDPPDGIFDLDVHRIGESPKMPAHDHVDVRFWFRAPSEILPVSPEGSEFRWMTWAEYAATDPTDTGLARVAAKASRKQDESA